MHVIFELALTTIDSILLKEVYFKTPGSKNTHVTSFIQQLIKFYCPLAKIAIERCDILQL